MALDRSYRLLARVRIKIFYIIFKSHCSYYWLQYIYIYTSPVPSAQFTSMVTFGSTETLSNNWMWHLAMKALYRLNSICHPLNPRVADSTFFCHIKSSLWPVLFIHSEIYFFCLCVEFINTQNISIRKIFYLSQCIGYSVGIVVYFLFGEKDWFAYQWTPMWTNINWARELICHLLTWPVA